MIPLLGQLCAITTGASPNSSITIGLQNLDRDVKRNDDAWSFQSSASPGAVETTAVLPVDVDSVFAAKCENGNFLVARFYADFSVADGELYRLPFSQLAQNPPQTTENALGSRVTRLWFVTEEWSKNLFLLGAMDDGGIGCWDARYVASTPPSGYTH